MIGTHSARTFACRPVKWVVIKLSNSSTKVEANTNKDDINKVSNEVKGDTTHSLYGAGRKSLILVVHLILLMKLMVMILMIMIIKVVKSIIKLIIKIKMILKIIILVMIVIVKMKIMIIMIMIKKIR